MATKIMLKKQGHAILAQILLCFGGCFFTRELTINHKENQNDTTF